MGTATCGAHYPRLCRYPDICMCGTALTLRHYLQQACRQCSCRMSAFRVRTFRDFVRDFGGPSGNSGTFGALSFACGGSPTNVTCADSIEVCVATPAGAAGANNLNGLRQQTALTAPFGGKSVSGALTNPGNLPGRLRSPPCSVALTSATTAPLWGRGMVVYGPTSLLVRHQWRLAALAAVLCDRGCGPRPNGEDTAQANKRRAARTLQRPAQPT
jgi:hypothetical protein